MKSPLTWMVWAISATALIFATAAGNWADALDTLIITALFTWAAALTDRVTELTQQRDALITRRLTHYARNPHTDWEN